MDELTKKLLPLARLLGRQAAREAIREWQIANGQIHAADPVEADGAELQRRHRPGSSRAPLDK